ncbi:signal peptide-containing protein [Theileria equi strain WA]|uniref:Signal peptide-containing protein n=1 Tax=Theileria equi strain WA TaxID=1537102 RepID=L0AXK2_THEEQ|nr:signal peptide-containing protein [Theileria equi strain WA]AFZ79968.1 signal peptide-containing protein [Theileria equi strain WA]|eukprot:XP_004829634.1 signal peptide-containing protein [Theileria equi strain WA]
MKILALLYAVYLLGLGCCEDDDKVLESVIIPVDTVPETPLDIGNIDPSLYLSNGFNDEGIDCVLIVPREGVLVNKVVCGETIIWSCGEGENFEYAKLYLKDGEPMVILIAKVRGNLALGRSYVRNGDIWECRTDTSQEKIHDLRVPMERTRSFIINLEEDKDTTECRIFDTKLIGAPARLYYAKPGYKATELLHAGVSIWKAEKGEICTSCNLYYCDGTPIVLVIVLKGEIDNGYIYLKWESGKWRESDREEFDVERDKLRDLEPITTEEAIEELLPYRSLFSVCLGTLTLSMNTVYEYTSSIFSRLYNMRNLRHSNNTTGSSDTDGQDLETIVVYSDNVETQNGNKIYNV